MLRIHYESVGRSTDSTFDFAFTSFSTFGFNQHFRFAETMDMNRHVTDTACGNAFDGFIIGFDKNFVFPSRNADFICRALNDSHTVVIFLFFAIHIYLELNTTSCEILFAVFL